jgi:hypothetical protein
LLTSTITGDFLTGGDATALDIVQGNPARVRDLGVGVASLRTLRAETATSVPRIEANLALSNGALSGTLRNLSVQLLERPAIVLGGSVLVLPDLEPGRKIAVSLPIVATQFGQSLSDRILGPLFFGDTSSVDDSTRRDTARHFVIDQLTYDPNWGSTGQLPSEAPVLLAWGSGVVLDVRVDGSEPRRTGTVLYYVPLDMAIEGPVAFESDLIRSSVVEVDALFFNKDPYSISLGTGSVTLAYRPIAFEGTLAADQVLMSFGFGGETGIGGGVRPVPVEPGIEPVPRDDQPACDPSTKDCAIAVGLPDVEVYNRTGAGSWDRLPALTVSRVYALSDPSRYVDPATGTVLLRFVADRPEGSNFSFQLRIEGSVS